jgi:hypothetical protein
MAEISNPDQPGPDDDYPATPSRPSPPKNLEVQTRFCVGQYVWAERGGRYYLGKILSRKAPDLYLIEPISHTREFWAEELVLEFASDGELMLTNWERRITPNHRNHR